MQQKIQFHRWIYGSAILALLLLMLASGWTQQHIRTQFRKELKLSLETVLDTADYGVHAWLEEQFAITNYWAHQVQIQQACLRLLKLKEDPAALRHHPVQKELRKWFQDLDQWHEYQGYFLISPQGISLSSSRDSNTGTQNLLWSQQDFIKRVLAGKVVLSQPLWSDVPLPDAQGQLQEKSMTVFVGAPIRDKQGKVAAIFTLRLDPNRPFTDIVWRGRMGQTGESYLVDRQGRMISNSRFEKQLTQIGLLQPGQHSALNIQMHDPGINLLHRAQPSSAPETWPLTQMAQELLSGHSGLRLKPYRDYRGVPVIGAWKWDPKLKLGIVTEQDANEAYLNLDQVLWALNIFTLFAGLLLLGLVLLFVFFQRRVFQSEKALRDSEERFRTLFDSAGEAIFLLDGDILIDCNPKAWQLFEATRDQLMGQSFRSLLPEQEWEHTHVQESLQSRIEAALMGHNQFFEWRSRRLDGQEFDAEISLNCLHLGEQIYLQALVRDIQARKRAERELKQARNHAEAANAAKERFLMNMSHQFRTPLNAILGFAQILQQEEVKTEQGHPVQRWITGILSSGQELLALLNKILESIQLDAGQIKIEAKETDLPQMLQLLAQKYGDKARQKGLDFSLVQDEPLPQSLKLDAVKVEAILKYLLDNAINFTQQGWVKLRVSWSQKSEQYWLFFELADTGPGISEQDQKRIFEQFEQVVIGAEARSGAGLGLNLVREYVQLLGGALSLTSVLGRGSTFVVQLPLEPVNGERIKKLKAQPEKNWTPLVLVNTPKPLVAVETSGGLTQKWLEDFSSALNEVDQERILELLATAGLSESEHQHLMELVYAFEIEQLNDWVESILATRPS